jgi:hypothetical protein
MAQMFNSEPRVLRLVHEARALRRKTHADFCANAVWYGLRGKVRGFQDRVALGWEHGAAGPDRWERSRPLNWRQITSGGH